MNGRPTPAQKRALLANGRKIGRVTNTAPVIPRNSAELAEMLADPKRLKATLGPNPTEGLKILIEGYAAHQRENNPDIARQAADESVRALAALLRDAGASDKDTGYAQIKRLNLTPETAPAMLGSAHRQATAYNRFAPGAKFDAEYAGDAIDTVGEVVRLGWHKTLQGQLGPELQGKAQRLLNSFSSVIPDAGGFLIPEVMRSTLMMLALPNSIVRPRATVIPMDSLRVPIPIVDSTSNASSVHGGMVGYWTEEAGALVESQAKFGRVVLEAKKLTGYSVIPNELFQDAIGALIAFIETQWPKVIAWFEDLGFMRGTGTGEPLGFLGTGNPAAIAVAKESGQAANTILWENIVTMFSRMFPSSMGKGIWLAAPNAMRELFTMALAVGTGGSPVFVNSASEAAPVTILGRPVIFDERMSTVGTRGDIAFVDLSHYLVGDRMAMTMDSSPHVRFANDQTAVRIINRVDGRPWLTSPITPQNGSTDTLSPFVELATRA